MRQRALIGALGLVLIGVILGATVFRSDIAQATGLKQSQSVIVDNTPAEAVPVREQNVDGGNVKVHEQGTANVKVTNTPTVVETGTPIQAEQVYSFNGLSFDDAMYAVPAGKRLRIDLITFHDQNRPVGIGQFEVSTTVGGSQVHHFLATSTQAHDGDVATDPVTIYADPGTAVRFFVSLDGPLGGGGVTLAMESSFSGILTDAT